MSNHFEELIEHAAALCDAGEFDEASGLLERVVERDPADWRARSLLARAELGAERYEQAVDQAARACRLSGHGTLPHLVASFALDRLGRSQEAVRHAREAVRIDPFDWRALDRLAVLRAREGADSPEVHELIERMLALAPREPEAHLTAGRVAAAAEDRAGAQRAFRRVLELDPGNAAAQHALAGLRLRRRVNDPAVLAAAAAGYSRAARADPEAGRSRAAVEALLRVFLSKTAYLLLIDAYVVGRLSAKSGGAVARLLPLLVLTIPAFYAWRFCAHLTAPVRSRLVGVILGKGPLRFAAACEALAVLAIVAGSGIPQSARPGLAGTAGVLALLGRIVIYTQLEHAKRAVRGQPARPAVRPRFVWALGVLVVGVLAAVLLAAALR